MGEYYLKSMTGYGRGSSSSSSGFIEVELQGVNRRHLEIQLNLPKPLDALEMPVRQHCEKAVGRGFVKVSVYFKPSESELNYQPDIALARAMKRGYVELIDALELKKEITLDHFIDHPKLFEMSSGSEHEMLKEELFKTLDEALSLFVEMRAAEGSRLALDLFDRTCALKRYIDMVESLAEEFARGQLEKLKTRLSQAFSQAGVTRPLEEERLRQEIVLLLERGDISEEIVRFKGHVSALQGALSQPFTHATETRGKKLEFLVQELVRETNTIGAKAANYLIGSHVIEMKCELEKIREQLQNIE